MREERRAFAEEARSIREKKLEAEQEMHDKIAEEVVEEVGAEGSGAQVQHEGEEEEEAPQKGRKKRKST